MGNHYTLELAANMESIRATPEAKYGYDSIPRYYIDNLYNENEYREKVNKFLSATINEKEKVDEARCG